MLEVFFFFSFGTWKSNLMFLFGKFSRTDHTPPPPHKEGTKPREKHAPRSSRKKKKSQGWEKSELPSGIEVHLEGSRTQRLRSAESFKKLDGQNENLNGW